MIRENKLYKTSLQTNTWGDPQHNRFAEIFSIAKASGFNGLEIGFNRLREIKSRKVFRLLDEYQMVINATHIHGNLGNPKLAENLSKELAGALKYLRQLGVPFILYSGLNELQDEELDFAISQLNIFANRCTSFAYFAYMLHLFAYVLAYSHIYI